MVKTRITNNAPVAVACGMLGLTAIIGGALVSSQTFADDVVDPVEITVPSSCSMTGTGMGTHTDEIANGTYQADIGTTTLHAFCNDAEGFAIYAVGFTDDTYGKNVLTNAAIGSTYDIASGIATSAGDPDVSNWAMKLAITQDSGETTGSDAFAIDSAPNVEGGADASFGSYHTVPAKITKVAHKESGTDMTPETGGVKLTTTYAAYISKNQPAGTYSGQVKYTLVHPITAPAPRFSPVTVVYSVDGATFSDGETTNTVVYNYESIPMYTSKTPTILASPNVGDDGIQTGDLAPGTDAYRKAVYDGATRLRVVLNYDLTEEGAAEISFTDVDFDPATDDPDDCGWIWFSDGFEGKNEFTIESDAITFNIYSEDGSSDYGYYAQVYPMYETEQPNTELSYDFATITSKIGTYELPSGISHWVYGVRGLISEEDVMFTLDNERFNLNGKTITLMGGTSN